MTEANLYFKGDAERYAADPGKCCDTDHFFNVFSIQAPMI